MIRVSKILKGRHRGNIWIGCPKRTLMGIIHLNKSMIADGNFISKLTGISGYNLKGQKCSARIGWKSINGIIEIWAYVYNNGISPQQNLIQKCKLGSFEVGEKVPFVIQYTKNGSVIYDIGLGTTSIKARYPIIRYLAMPFYGGSPTAPHKIDIEIDFN